MSTLEAHIIPVWLRRSHRWISIAFTATVIANFIVRALGTPPLWVTYSPLLPLTLLVITGLYLFTLPYAEKWHRGARDDRVGREKVDGIGPNAA